MSSHIVVIYEQFSYGRALVGAVRYMVSFPYITFSIEAQLTQNHIASAYHGPKGIMNSIQKFHLKLWRVDVGSVPLRIFLRTTVLVMFAPM